MAQYDIIAEEYATNEMKMNFREEVEYHTFLYRLLLPGLGQENRKPSDIKTLLKDYSVLDLACGDGYYTRRLKKELGCKEIVGVDISAKMIEIARMNEAAQPLGITYHVGDVQDLYGLHQKFNIITAFYLLNYAKTREELEDMAKAISLHLDDTNSGQGLFLSITTNVFLDEAMFVKDRYLKYGYTCEAQMPLVDGIEVKNTHWNSDGSSFSYITYYLSRTTYEEAFRKVGFSHIQWIPVEARSNQEFYEDLIKCSPIIGLLARK